MQTTNAPVSMDKKKNKGGRETERTRGEKGD